MSLPTRAGARSKLGLPPAPGGRGRRQAVAETFRANWPPEEFAYWLREVAAGRDPDRELPPEGQPDHGAAPIEWPIRMRAAKMYGDRAYGLPAQHVQVEADIKSSSTSATIALTGRDLASMDDGRLAALKSALRGVLPAGVTDPARVIDVGGGGTHAGGDGGGGDGMGPGYSAEDEDDLEDEPERD